jgi:hypothetical protein
MILVTLFLLSNCEKGNYSTYIYGKIINESNQGLKDVPVAIYGLKKGSLGRLEIIQTLYTDKQGNYSVTFVPDRQYSGIDINNEFHKVDSLEAKYRSYNVYFNGQRPSNCCGAQIGYTSEYNFTMLSR